MCHFSILVLLFTCAIATPIHYTRNYDLFEGREPSDMITARTKHVENQKLPKNLSGKTDQTGYYKTFGSDADGEKGYEGATFSKGEKGYKELDTYHKEIGDRYGFEEHLEFGKEQDKENHRTKDNEGTDDGQTAGNSVEAYYADSGEGSSGSGEYSGGGGYSASTGGNGNYNEEYSSGGGGEGEYSRSSSYSHSSKDGDKKSGEDYY